MGTPLVEVRHLKKYFNTPRGALHAVDDVNLTINKGETLGVVGESGCGKSTLGRTMLRLLPHTSGEVLFEGNDILKYDAHQMKALRQDMQMIFQDPYASLDSRYTVSQIIEEPLILCRKEMSKEDRNKRVKELMDIVGLAQRFVNDRKVATNADRVIGREAVVTEDIDNLQGKGRVSISGADWTARTEDDRPVPAGSKVQVLRIEGVKVIVAPAGAAGDPQQAQP